MTDLFRQPDLSNVQNDRSDEVVKFFLDSVQESELDQNRMDQMDEIEENRLLKDEVFALLAKGKKLKRFKDSLLLQTSRRYTEEGSDIPKPFARSRQDQLQLGYAAEALLELEYDTSYFYKVFSSIFSESNLFTDSTRIEKSLVAAGVALILFT